MKNLIIVLLFVFCSFIGYSQQWKWAKGLGGSSAERAWDITWANGVITVGQFEGELVINENTYLSEGITDVFIVKTDNLGKVLYTQTFGSTGEDVALSVDTDLEGNVYVTGYFTGELTILGETYIAEGWDSYILKLDNEGNMIDFFRFQNVSSDIGYGLSVDNENNILVTGWFQETINFSESLSLTSYGGSDIFVAKFSADLTPLWAKHAGTESIEYGYKLSTDEANNIYVTGVAGMNTNFDGMLLSNSGVFVAKYNTNGEIQKLGNNTGSGVNSISVSPDGSGFITGRLTGSAYFNGENDTLVNSVNGTDDVYVAKFNNNCEWLWVRLGAGEGSNKGRACNADANGNVYVTGSFNAQIDFNSWKLTANEGADDIFVAKYSSDGALQHLYAAGGEFSDIPTAICNNADTVYITGWYNGTTSFGDFDLTSITGADLNFFNAALELTTTGINETENNSTFSITPNPARDFVNVNFSEQEVFGNGTYKIVDVNGRTVLGGDCKTNSFSVNINTLPQGVYFILIETENKTLSEKFVKIF